MKVALDTSALYTTRAGIARYIHGLNRGFAELNDSALELEPLVWPVKNFEFRQPIRALKTMYRELFWAPFTAPGILRSRRTDLLHSPSNWFITPPPSLPHVVTLHDLALLRHPKRFRIWQRHAGLRRLAYVKRADRIICVSQFSADEGIQLLDLDPSKIEVIHHGVDFVRDSEQNLERPKSLPNAPYFLFVGSLEPGKNLRLIREVYELAERRGKELPALAIAGARWAGVKGEGSPPPSWHYLGHVSDEELVRLYRNALSLVFPSKYEGFGMPLLEAMNLGCPTIASRVASLPEVGGDATIWTRPEAEAYLDHMFELANNAAMRSEARAAGHRQSEKFSWKRCASEVATVYRDAVSSV